MEQSCVQSGFWARTLLLWRKQDFDIKTSLLKSLSCMMKVTIKQRGLGATTTLAGVASFRLFDDIQNS
jgi:hypothetical protein